MITRTCLCLCTAAFLGFAGCSDSPSNSSGHRSTARTTHHQKKADDDDDDHNMKKPPRVGMTKAQVRAAYGSPDSRDVTDDGEVWFYHLNLGDAVASSFNPFDYGDHSRLRAGRIYFGANGRVKKYRWDAGDSDE